MLHCELQQLDGNQRLWTNWHDLLHRVRPELRLFGPEWFSIWEKTIGSAAPWSGRIDVVTVRDDANGSLVGVLPVGHPKVGMLRVNAVAGYFQPWRTILADAAREFDVGRALAWFLVELNWNVLQLGPWPRSYAAHQGVLSAFDELGVYVRRQSSCGWAVADLPRTWEQCRTQTIDRKQLRQITNCDRRLHDQHRIEVRHHRGLSREETREVLAALSHIERRSWLSADPHSRPRFQTATDQRFWLEIMQCWLIPNNSLDCWLLYADGQPISFVLAITVASTRYVIANQYDDAWSRFRPGSCLYLRMFEEGYQRNVTRYDFGTNELHFKALWGAKSVDQIDTYAVATNHLVGGMLHAGVKLHELFGGSLWGHAQPDIRLASGEFATIESREVDRAKRVLDVSVSNVPPWWESREPIGRP